MGRDEEGADGVTLGALELPAAFDDLDAQLERVAATLAASPAIDLLLLPEAALTGYVSPALDFDLARFGEPSGGPTESRVATIARASRSAIVFPYVEADGARRFNAIAGVDVAGDVFFRYRKRHPWYPETWATPGDAELPRFVFRGLRITAAICFDVHFLAGESAETLRWADVLLFPSAWVDEGGDGRAPILRALADRFDVTIVNANWGRGEPAVPGQGDSRIVAPRDQPRIVGADGVVTCVVAPRP